MHKLLTKKEKEIFYITLYFVILFVFSCFIIGPLLKKSRILNKKINFTKIKLIKYQQLVEKKGYIQNKNNKLSSNFAAAGGNEDIVITALSELEDFAKKANIQIVDVRPQAATGSSGYKEILIDLKAEGDIEGFLKFIYEVENSIFLLKIKKFQLTAEPSGKLLRGVFSISQLLPASAPAR